MRNCSSRKSGNSSGIISSWAAKVKKAKEVALAIVVQNNNYAGFAPGSANAFRKMVDLPEAGKAHVNATSNSSGRI